MTITEAQYGAMAAAYNQMPRYGFAGDVGTGWDALCASLPATGVVIAVDGPAILDWDALAVGVRAALHRRGIESELIDLRELTVPWEQVVSRTAPVERLRDDPDFATLASGEISDLFDRLPVTRTGTAGLVLVAGPGAALTDHDVLWYADLPKRYAESAVTAGHGRNLGQRSGDGPPSARRLFYLDWPLQDRHRDRFGPRIERWVDLQVPAEPRWISGEALRAGLRALSRQPFRTRPVFNSTPWGGHWAQDELGFNPEARNTALGYELIAPESGILLGSGSAVVEIPLQFLVALHPDDVLGPHVHAQFGRSFPIRFDYLDTLGGGSLSVHCHPTEQDMREVFGWPYTQHESYYVMDSSDASVVYLGLRGDASTDDFLRCAQAADEHGIPFEIERFVQTFPARQHQLFLIPAGTPHASSAGNVVLEISATPYLYSLRFYDWLRTGQDGTRRPVHVEHAFRNLNHTRRGPAVADALVQQPRILRGGAGWHEELIGALPEMFYTVRRLVLTEAGQVPQHTDGRFHVLTVVDGAGAVIEWSGGQHPLAYAETIVVPAAVGEYSVAAGSPGARLVQAAVR
jgi:mannose-6-phosphate isomerase class I